MTSTELWLVPHTHWDREWYEPHDVFRARLVRELDGLLDVLDKVPSYRFTLDGQSAAIEDYLALRPERTEQVRSAVERGQLAIGPFHILLDEFTGDGETTIRNLELGIAAARRLGGEMRLGYLPDMFGHAAQTPQILRGFGLGDACLWRGVPGAVDQHAFVWEALDGSQVRVEYLWDSYGNALKLFDPLDKLPELVADYAQRNDSWFGGEPMLGMFGTDHSAPRADLADILVGYARAGHDVAITQLTLGEVVSRRDHSAEALARLPRVVGEMRSHARGNLLPGVFSIRTNIKDALASAERWLTAAERLDALVGERSVRSLLDRAWGLVVESTAHDSANGCGVDATAEQVETRLHVAEHSARGVIDIVSPGLCRRAARGDLAVFNPGGWARTALVEHVVEREPSALPEAAQLVEALPEVIGDERFRSEDLPRILRRIHGQELFGKHIRSWSWEGDQLEFVVADLTDDDFDLAEFEAVLRAKMTERPDHEWRVITRVPPTSRVVLGVDVGGLGTVSVGVDSVRLPARPVAAIDGGIGNGLVEVSVVDTGACFHDLASGTRLVDALRLVDDGDCGDSYNFGIVDGGVITEPVAQEVVVEEVGPWRGRLLWRRDYDLPVGITADRRRTTETVRQRVDTRLEVRAGEPWVRVTVSLTNQARNHRLRVLVPTMQAAVEGSWSAGQYGVTSRGRSAEGGWGEYPLPTFPATRFVGAGGVHALVDKLVEYEVVDGAPDQLALTVVRSVGMMSVNVHPYRDEPAGAELPVPGAQYLGVPVELRFAVDLTAPDWSRSDIVAHADAFRFEPIACPGSGVGGEAPEGFAVEGRVALESLRRVDDGLEARFVNYQREDQPLRFLADGEWRLAGMDGSRSDTVVDPRDHVVRAGQILTLHRAL